jgi:hypothetical protein
MQFAHPGVLPLVRHTTTSVDIVDLLGHAVLFVDSASRVLFASRAAETLLADRAGLRTIGDGLCASTPDETSLLRKRISECAVIKTDVARMGDPIYVSRGGERGSLTVLIVPHRGNVNWQHSSQPTAMLLVSDPDRNLANPIDHLSHGFDLTPAETALALEVAKGSSLQVAAHRLAVSLATVRTHLGTGLRLRFRRFSRKDRRFRVREAYVIRGHFSDRPSRLEQRLRDRDGPATGEVGSDPKILRDRVGRDELAEAGFCKPQVHRARRCPASEETDPRPAANTSVPN